MSETHVQINGILIKNAYGKGVLESSSEELKGQWNNKIFVSFNYQNHLWQWRAWNELLSDSIEIAWVVSQKQQTWAKFFTLFTLENGAVKLLSIHCAAEMSIVCEHICLAD